MSDIFEMRNKEWCEALLAEKAKKIVELQAEIERLRAALRMLYDEMDEYQRINNLSAYNNQVMRIARAELDYRKMEGK